MSHGDFVRRHGSGGPGKRKPKNEKMRYSFIIPGGYTLVGDQKAEDEEVLAHLITGTTQAHCSSIVAESGQNAQGACMAVYMSDGTPMRSHEGWRDSHHESSHESLAEWLSVHSWDGVRMKRGFTVVPGRSLVNKKAEGLLECFYQATSHIREASLGCKHFVYYIMTDRGSNMRSLCSNAEKAVRKQYEFLGRSGLSHIFVGNFCLHHETTTAFPCERKYMSLYRNVREGAQGGIESTWQLFHTSLFHTLR